MKIRESRVWTPARVRAQRRRGARARSTAPRSLKIYTFHAAKPFFFPRALLCGTNKIVRRGGDGRTDNQGKKYIYILGATQPLDVEGYLLRLNDLDKTKQPPVQT